MTAAPVSSPGRHWLSRGYPRSFAIGATFSIAWSPCIGPILGVVLTLAATSGTAYQGALLLFAYSLGLGVWFIAMGAFFGWLSPRLRRLNPYLPKLMVASGAVFIVVGILMVLGDFERMARYFQGLGFLFESTASAEQNLSTGLEGWLGPGIAFFGGIVSFLSPCVLPLVPVYLINIAGEAVLGGAEGGAAARARVLGNAIAFVIGFTVVFTAVGASVGLAGSLVTDQLPLLTRIGGGILMFFGLHMSGLITVPFLDRTFQVR
ncbi:MAG: sulfite exporter TauE/SafE family protein [Chloroflexi bacterium]|nr:sulfite exporter TauE/SafE family protein [Chloroflexota bacterium]MDA1239769.1 sulfite exporter TauE/SafE family protein [Chloroflexota bacterium]MQC25419.1 hypothetical protein [Chloroflexota bacterium]MQC48105.1 hypothetical protein [Chloroflexota bacterium]